MKYDVFISYSRKDIEFAREVCAVLDSYKQYYTFEYFFDQSEITSANEYLDRISSAIYESRVVFFIASENSYGSRFCAKELLFADDEGKNIHQYRIDEAPMPHKIKMLLGNHQYRELKSTPIDNMVREVLADALGCEISTLEKLVENDNLRKQQAIKQQEVRDTIIALETQSSEIKEMILSYEQMLDDLNIQKRAVDRQIRDLRNLLVEDEVALPNDRNATMSNVVLPKPKREDGGQGSVLSGLENIYKRVSGLVEGTMMTLELESKSVDSKVYKVGDYYDDGTRQGVVFEVSKDGKHGKIVSLKEAELEWCTKKQYNKNILVGADSKNDGKANTKEVMLSDYLGAEHPAFKWCIEQGNKWYLPSTNELKELYKVKVVVNKTLTKYSHKEIRDWWYWSSTERDEFCAWGVIMGGGNTSYGTKNNDYFVRAVSAF